MRGVTGALIVANVLVYWLQAGAQGDALLVRYALWPLGAAPLATAAGEYAGFEWWQLFTYAFLHGNATHLLLNMFALWMFGREVESTLGALRYLVLFFAAVFTAACAQLAFASVTGEVYPTVGASGGVFGLLLAFAMLFPRRRVMLLLPPVPMPAWLFVSLYGVVELVSGAFGTGAGVAHFAHLGGMLGALVAMLAWRDRLRFGGD